MGSAKTKALNKLIVVRRKLNLSCISKEPFPRASASSEIVQDKRKSGETQHENSSLSRVCFSRADKALTGKIVGPSKTVTVQTT
jgi:hypothetical protein